MCGPALAISAVGAAASVAGTVMSHSAQKKAANDQKAYNRTITEAREQYSKEVEAWQNAKYDQDLAYISDILDYRESEFDRYKTWREDVEDSVQEDYFGKLGATMARMVEEAMASEFQIMGYREQGQAAEGEAVADAANRGVAGNSVRAMVGEIERQEANAVTQATLSKEATQKQLQRTLEAHEAEAESTLLNLPRLTFEPIRMPDAPAPVNPVEPAPPVATPSMAAAGLNMISTGVSTFASLHNAFK